MRFSGDDYEETFPGQYELWEANWDRHKNGKGGQAVLCEVRDALLALPEKKLILNRLADASGCVCTVGALALYRKTQSGIPRDAALAELAAVVPDDEDSWEAEEKTIEVGKQLGLKVMMAVTLASRNDDVMAPVFETDEERYTRVLRWVERNITPASATGASGSSEPVSFPAFSKEGT